MNANEHAAVGRRWRSARTWFRSAAYGLAYLHGEEVRPEVRWLIGYDAATLLGSVLSEAEQLVAVLADDDQLEDVRREALTLMAALDARSALARRERLAAKLSNTKGRTPVEAAAFRARARELLA